MKVFQLSALAVIALTIGGFFGIGEAALGLLGLMGLGALLIDASKARKTSGALGYGAFGLASLGLIAMFVQGFFAVHEMVMGFSGLIALLSLLFDVHFVRRGRLEPMKAYNLSVLALVVMLLGGFFAVSDQVIGYAGLIGLIALVFDFSRSQPKVLPPSDQELIERDVPPVNAV